MCEHLMVSILYNSLEIFKSFVAPCLKNAILVGRENGKQFICANKKSGLPRKLSIESEFVVTLMRLRLCLPQFFGKHV